MAHASRKILVTTKATTNWKKTPRTYAAKTTQYGYPRDDTALTTQAYKAAEKSYKTWLKDQITDEREMLHLQLDQSHRIKED